MEKTRTWNQHLRLAVLSLLLTFGLLLGNIPVSAAPNTPNTTLKLQKMLEATESQMIFSAVLPEHFYGEYRIYRATKSPQKGGKMNLVDTFPTSGSRWSMSSIDTYWHTQGKKEKMYCFSSKASLSGEVQFLDSGLKLGRTYYYRITFIPDSGKESVSSNIISGKTVLTSPVFLKCYANTNSSVKLVWTQTPKATGYAVYRAEGNSKKWSRVNTITKGTTTSFTDTTLKSGKTYCYKVKAYCKVNGKNCYSGYSDIRKATLKSPTVKGTYSQGSVYGPSLGASQLSEVRRVVQSFKDNYITTRMSDLNKVWLAYQFIRVNCSYAHRGWQYNGANTAWGALVYGEAQCSGFARGMKALCDGIGVDCHYVHADSHASNPSHQWNQVKVDGKWYILDAQSGFFLVGTDTWRNQMGMSWNTNSLPKCSAKDHKNGGFTSSIF